VRGVLLRPLVLAALALGPAAAAAPGDVDAALAEAAAGPAAAARGILLDDRAVLLAEADLARTASDAAFAGADAELAPANAARLRGRLAKFGARLAEASAAAVSPTGTPKRTAALLRRAAKAGYAARRALPASSLAALDLRVPGGGFGRPGQRRILRVVGGNGALPSVGVANGAPGTAVDPAVEVLSPRKVRVRFGPDAGLASLTVDDGGGPRTVRLFNLGPPGTLPAEPGWGDAGAPPAGLAYPAAAVSWRAGVPLPAFPGTVSGGWPAEFAFEVSPALPQGISLDPATGALSGTPSADAPAADYLVTASNLHGAASATVRIEVAPALPPGLLSLPDGFAAERWLDGLSVPVKMASLPDGRLLFNELGTGNVRVVAADGTLLPAPFATVAVETGGERGLLGLAPAPDFAASAHVFVYAIVPAAGPEPVRGQVIRFTASGDAGGSPLVVVDDLPAAMVQNGGDLQFGPDGMLYVSVGDNGDSANAQSGTTLSGKVLRYAPDGSIPSDNPDPASPEWVRGLRNSFDMAFHAGTGGLFASENGPTYGDEVNLLLGGRNYGWETLPQGFPLNLVGPRVVAWTPVIAPTGVAFHDGTGFGPEYADNLLLASYDGADVRRLLLSGPILSDLDVQLPFLRFEDAGGVDNKPLDLLVRPDGALLVSTFTSIWRIRRYGNP
jgi:glucose/arabinose dehydrogenase